MDVSITNELNSKNIEIEKEQNNFLETTIGKIINTGLDVGIKFLLPDFVENEVIEIKDTIIQEGFKEGIKKTISEAIDLGKSTIGVVTGKFENIGQMQKAVEIGGIIESVSTGIDKALYKINENGKLNSNIVNVIKKGKNLILDNISNNIEEMILEQGNEKNKFEESINNWKEGYQNKDFNLMEKEIKNIKENLEKLIPIESLIKEGRTIENIHNIIKNNNKNFDINILQLNAANALA